MDSLQAKEQNTKATDILRNGGKISRTLPGYQERQAQIEMTQLVETSIVEQRPALLEAATGTGKSLGYLIPLVETGKRAIISTGNKALQDQLFFKDIPFVQKHVRQFQAALIKGKNNYLCLDRMERYRNEWPELVEKDDTYKRLAGMTNDPDFEGDFEHLPFFVNDDLKQKINVDAEECAVKKCTLYNECYYFKMREAAKQAQILVVNHDLLLLDASMGGRLLPPRDIIVVDEAHKLEDVATNVFTTTIAPARVWSLLSLKRLMSIVTGDTRHAAERQAMVVWQRLEQMYSQGSDTLSLYESIEEGLTLASRLDNVANELLVRKPLGFPDEREEFLYKRLMERAEKLASEVRKVFSVNSSESVYYLKREYRRGKPQVNAFMVPLSVASFLQTHFFKKNTVIAVSATLAAPDFEYFKLRTGMTDVRMIERVLPPVFDYPRNALLYLPKDISEPAYGAGPEVRLYEELIAERMLQLVKLSQGRAFLLFSSKRMLNMVYDTISSQLCYPLLKQGDMPTAEMTRQFREAGNAVLFGLKSFWEGIDVAGDALSLVVIDKLPFNHFDDPVHKARLKQVKAEHGGWQGYGLYEIPQVIIKLKQGVGRLIRTDTDRGVMAILDARMHTKGYAKTIRAALPKAIETSSLQDVERFFC